MVRANGQRTTRELKDDLVRARRGVDPRREARERMASLAHAAGGHLDPVERAVLEAVFVHGHTCAELARLRGTPGYPPALGDASRRTQATSEARRLRRLLGRVVDRVLSPEFMYVANLVGASGLPAPPGWSSTRRRVATAIFLRGLSVRAAARELGLSQHVVRLHSDAVRAMADAARAAQARMGGAA